MWNRVCAIEQRNESNTKMMFSICFCYFKWSNSESILSCSHLPEHTQTQTHKVSYEKQAEIFSDIEGTNGEKQKKKSK